MDARQTKKLIKTPLDRLSDYWWDALRRGKDERINKALRKWNKRTNKTKLASMPDEATFIAQRK